MAYRYNNVGEPVFNHAAGLGNNIFGGGYPLVGFLHPGPVSYGSFGAATLPATVDVNTGVPAAAIANAASRSAAIQELRFFRTYGGYDPRLGYPNAYPYGYQPPYPNAFSPVYSPLNTAFGSPYYNPFVQNCGTYSGCRSGSCGGY